MDFLDTLNLQQREAVTTVDGPLLVLAGAGSGKTRVITYRIIHLIQRHGIRPGNILAVTFTNKAAQEMRERVAALMPPMGDRNEPTVSTFHSLCVRMLRRHIDKLGGGYTGNFTIYDTDDQTKLVKACMKDLNLDEKTNPPRAIQFAISSAKNHGLGYQELLSATDPKKAVAGKVFKLYEDRLTNNNALDFDDLLLKSVRLLRHDQEVRDYYNRWFQYILIDEYQDTNPPQFNLIRLLTEAQQNLCVVGDPDQSIYRFRAADIQNILNFEKHYPGARLIKLTENYRSTKAILNAANEVIKNNTQRKEKDLVTQNEGGGKVRYFQAYSGEHEAEFVTREIVAWQRRMGNDFRAAILYRTNAQSRLFEEACRRLGLKYVLVGGFSFYQRAEIKDAIAYLKLALNLNDSVSFDRVINTPPRGIGKTTLDLVAVEAREAGISRWEAMGRLIAEQKVSGRALNVLRAFQDMLLTLADKASRLPLADTVKAALSLSGYTKWLQEEKTDEAEARLLNLEELVSAAVEAELRDESLRDFIDHAALVADTDALREDAPVTLMTVHSAKGLEFPLVFVVGLEQGLFPHSRSVGDRLELEEERRLCYVALTRAKQQLYLTHAEWRRVFGDAVYGEPSAFLKELPLDELEDVSEGQSWLKYVSKPETAARRAAADALSGKAQPPNLVKQAGIKTYNSVDNVRDFFKFQQAKRAEPASGRPDPPTPPRAEPKSGGGLRSGDRVKHEKYGVGTVLKREGDKIAINFPGYGMKKFIEAHAKLTKV